MNQGQPTLKILVVDDYEPFRRYYFSTLQQRNEFEIIGEASDGLDAIKKATELQPDLILLDIGLPKVNGLKVTAETRRLAPSAKILVVSQEFSFDIVEAALRLGASGYVHKSRIQRDLFSAIESVNRGQYFVSGVTRGPFGNASFDRRAVRHEIHFCSDEPTCIQSFTDFTHSALTTGKAAIVIATESHRAAVLESLSSRKWGVESAMRRGFLRLLDVSEKLSTSMLHESLDPVQFFDIAGDFFEESAKTAHTVHAPLVGICRECPTWLLENGNPWQALRLEQLWGLVADTFPVHLLCVYSSENILNHRNLVESIREQHSEVYSR